MHERNPLWGRLPRNVLLGLTTFGPIGQLKAPGTWGSVVGVVLFLILFSHLTLVPYIIIALVLIALSVPLCEEAEVRLGRRDPGCVILDECVAIPVCFLALPIEVTQYGWPWILAGFALFRFFDILKPLGISKLQTLRGGWGVVADDIAAAIATNIVLQAAFYLVQ